MDGQDASTDRSDDEGASESGWLALNDRHERGQNSQTNQHIERVDELDLLRQPDHLPLAPTRFIDVVRSEEHTSELQSPMRTSSAVFCLTNTKALISR